MTVVGNRHDDGTRRPQFHRLLVEEVDGADGEIPFVAGCVIVADLDCDVGRLADEDGLRVGERGAAPPPLHHPRVPRVGE